MKNPEKILVKIPSLEEVESQFKECMKALLSVDPGTGFYNQDWFLKKVLGQAIADARQNNSTFLLLILSPHTADIPRSCKCEEDFNKWLDLLTDIASTIKTHMRPQDSVCHMFHKFICLLPDANSAYAEAIAEK